MKFRFSFIVVPVVVSASVAALWLYKWSQSNCRPIQRTIGNAEFSVNVLEYRASGPRGASAKATILIIPPTGGVNPVDKSYAQNFCEAGFDTFILKTWTGWDEFGYELEIHQRFYERSIRAVEVVLSEVSSSFIGVFGTSVGALHLSNVVEVNARVDAAFLVVAGTPIRSIIVESDEKQMVDAHKKRFEIFGFKNDQQYEAAIDKVLSMEPMKLAKLKGNGREGKDIGMVIAKSDTTVPTRYQYELRDFWKPQVVYESSFNHFFAILETWWLRQGKIIQFFQDSAQKKE